MRKKTHLYSIVLILAMSLCFAFFPFITLFSGSKVKDYFFREFSYRLIYENSTKNCQSDSSRILSLYQFVKDHIDEPPVDFKTKDESPFGLLNDGMGYCDQQAHLLITLAAIGNIQGKLIFLYGYDSISHHAVCEIRIDGKYRMFDPYYNLIFVTKNHKLASIEDIQNNNFNFHDNSMKMPEGYLKLFETKYAEKTFLENEVNTSRKAARHIIQLWIKTCGKLLLNNYFSLYLSNTIWPNGIKPLKSPKWL